MCVSGLEYCLITTWVILTHSRITAEGITLTYIHFLESYQNHNHNVNLTLNQAVKHITSPSIFKFKTRGYIEMCAQYPQQLTKQLKAGIRLYIAPYSALLPTLFRYVTESE